MAKKKKINRNYSQVLAKRRLKKRVFMLKRMLNKMMMTQVIFRWEQCMIRRKPLKSMIAFR